MTVRRLVAAILVAVLGHGVSARAQGDPDAGAAAYGTGNHVAALEEWRPLAERGDADAQLMLGVMYRTGRGVPRDYAEAAKWMRRSAKQGQPSAQGILGVMYLKGEGVPQDTATAYAWISVAAARDAGDSRRLRDSLERMMTPADIAEGRRMAEDCAAQDYRGCGF